MEGLREWPGWEAGILNRNLVDEGRGERERPWSGAWRDGGAQNYVRGHRDGGRGEMPDLGTLTRRDGHWDGTSSRFDAQVPATRPKRGGGKPCGDSFWAREGERGTDAGSVQFASIGLVHSPRSPRTGSQSPLRSEAALSQTRSPSSLSLSFSRARGGSCCARFQELKSRCDRPPSPV